ncbi:glucokinase [Cesiribacter andamanensis]|uniref:Glucokinase n=1 Tax=Cesiribacter andamanensis AMV16 TaxID=1279009 RepID=M7N646_9BACT|nr:glucokinase [Cesiribacter andamanensis]EMR02742.1 Glucokinase [Cesiribacter andamanensis AMV16]
MLLPIHFPHAGAWLSKNQRILAADVGGTKTILELFDVRQNHFHSIKTTTYRSKDHSSFLEIVRLFLIEQPMPDKICIGIAGPVLQGTCKTTNLAWVVDTEEIRQQLGIPYVFLINDLEANAYGLAALSPSDTKTLHAGNPENGGNVAIIAAGTGLGEAGLFWDGKAYHPFPTEGGHASFSPRSELDIALCSYLQKQFGHVSWERVVSGMGIYNIYLFLRDVLKRDEPAWLEEKMLSGDPASVISKTALQGGCPICDETMQLFVHYLAEESANLVLKMKATGGLYLGGGIAPKILPLLTEERFMPDFFPRGRMRELLEGVPVYIILNPHTALLGAAHYGAYSGLPTTTLNFPAIELLETLD